MKAPSLALLTVAILTSTGWRHRRAENMSLTLAPTAFKGGHGFMKYIEGMPLAQREQAILDQVKLGNFPKFLLKLKPITIEEKIAGRTHKAVIFVMRDYFAIGNDSDYVRIPTTPVLAQKIADQLGFVIPTPKMVDEIYSQATVKLSPNPLPHGPDMVRTTKFVSHHDLIQEQIPTGKIGKLIAGHKKDIVLSPRLVKRPNQVAIYGWHRLNQKPIQPLSLVHDKQYVDYSHGLRLISKFMEVDGKRMEVDDVIRDRSLSKLLSTEGRMQEFRFPTSKLQVKSAKQLLTSRSS